MSGCTVRSRVFGSHTITLGAVVSSPDLIHVPLSRDIRTWCTDPTLNRSTPTLHSSIITFISQSPGDESTPTGRYLVSCDWSGVVAVHDSSWQTRYSFSAPNPPAAALVFLSPTKLVVLSRGTEDFKPGNVSVYELSDNEAVQIASVYENIYQVCCHGGFIYAWKWTIPEFTLLRYNENLEVLHSYTVLLEKGPAIGHVISEDHIVLALQSRDLSWLETSTMQPHPSEHLKGVAKSPIWAIQLVTRNRVLLQQSRDIFVVVDVISGNTVKMFHGPESFVCYMKLVGDHLWIGSVDALFKLDFTDCDLYNTEEVGDHVTMLTPSMRSFLFHEVSCCGVCLDENEVVSGDLGGNIFIWDATSDNIEPRFRTKIEDSIRCLELVRPAPTTVPAHDANIVVFIGTLTGSLLQWSPGAGEPVLISTKEDTITCIKTAGDKLCICMVTGEIELFQICYPTIETAEGVTAGVTEGVTAGVTEGVIRLEPVFQLKVHHPHGPTSSENAERFGSLNIKAEIWSCAFSPCRGKLATCSEDQTVRVTSLVTRDNLARFQDHALAVTCVTWFQHSDLSILVSCSDDNTVVVREMETLTKLRVLPCPDVIGFCTLTYLGVIVSDSVEHHSNSPSGDTSVELEGGKDIVKTFEERCKCSIKILCGSENGYLIIRDMVEGSVLFNERIHQGSIEGLSCGAGGRVATCSSDCTVQVHSVGE